MDWKQVYDDFPINKNYIWLNNCGSTPPCRQIIDKVNTYIDEYSLNGIYTKSFSLSKVKRSIKAIISELLNCNGEDIAIIHNTAEGMTLISYGLNLTSGDEILLLENEYPSNVYPWEHWASKGIILKTIPISNSPDIFLDNVKKIITKKTKVMTLSAVHWCTGMPLPIKDISEICNNNNIEFILDGAQGVGHININMKEMGLHYLCFSAWKWLIGPLGLGIMVVSKEKIDKLKYIFKGTDSVINSMEYFPYKKEIKHTAERYMYSSPNFNDWVYFDSALKYLKEIGFNNIRKRIFKLSRYLITSLKNIGFKPVYDTDKYPETGIAVVEKDEVNCKELSDSLFKNNIIAKERLEMLRLAPHIYNSFEQLDKTVEIIIKNQ